MKLVKVGAACLNQTPRDWRGNVANIIEAITQAKEAAYLFFVCQKLVLLVTDLKMICFVVTLQIEQ